jgi:hypothetical protein
MESGIFRVLWKNNGLDLNFVIADTQNLFELLILPVNRFMPLFAYYFTGVTSRPALSGNFE